MVRCAALAISFVFSVAAETAILECIADTRKADVLLLDFPFASIASFQVTKATLLVHVKSGAPPQRAAVAVVPVVWTERDTAAVNPDKLKFLSHPIKSENGGWYSVAVTPSLVELVAAGKGHGFAIKTRAALDTRENVQASPHLVVEGRNTK